MFGVVLNYFLHGSEYTRISIKTLFSQGFSLTKQIFLFARYVEKGFSHNDSYSHVKAFVYRHLMRNFKKALIVSWFIFIFLTLSFVYFCNREWKLLLLWSFNVNLQSNLNCNWDSKLFISTCSVTVATLLEVAVNDNCQ